MNKIVMEEKEKLTTNKPNFMKLLPVGAMLFHADRNGRKDRHDEANSSLSQFCKRAEILR
jgi:hypothetical protein